MKSVGNLALMLVCLAMSAAPALPQATERWLFLPYGQNPRLDKEPIIRDTNGRYELKFSFQGKPPAIHRFGRAISRDYPISSRAQTIHGTVSSIPSTSEINGLLETLSQAAIDSETTQTARASGTADPGPASGLANSTATPPPSLTTDEPEFFFP